MSKAYEAFSENHEIFRAKGDPTWGLVNEAMKKTWNACISHAVKVLREEAEMKRQYGKTWEAADLMTIAGRLERGE